MANISSAWGIMKLHGEWKPKDIEYLVRIMSLHEYFAYGIYWNEDTSAALAKNLRKNKEQPFHAEGRWAFTSNLERFFDVVDSIRMNDFYKRAGTTLRKVMNAYYYLLKNMKDRELRIKWEFVDEECGLGVLYKETGYHSVKEIVKVIYVTSSNSQTNTISSKIVYTSIETTNYEYNLKNYTEIFLEGDTESLSTAAFNLSKLFNIPEESIIELIKKHPTWYDLGTSYFWSTKEEVMNEYPKLYMDIIALNKSEVTDAT